jgi:type IV pilus assembly protein PilE
VLCVRLIANYMQLLHGTDRAGFGNQVLVCRSVSIAAADPSCIAARRPFQMERAMTSVLSSDMPTGGAGAHVICRRVAPGCGTGRRAKGFTLIELMVTVLVVAILASIAVPTYLQQVRKSRRSSAKATMMDLANREQQYLLSARIYADTAALQATGYTVPSDVSAYYTWAVTVNSTTVPTFTITFTAIGTQAVDGPLTLDQAGNRSPISKWQQ